MKTVTDAKVNAHDYFEETSLHTVVKKSNLILTTESKMNINNCFSLLFLDKTSMIKSSTNADQGTDVNVKDIFATTPIERAEKKGNLMNHT